jgi:hypothetical protein
LCFIGRLVTQSSHRLRLAAPPSGADHRRDEATRDRRRSRTEFLGVAWGIGGSPEVMALNAAARIVGVPLQPNASWQRRLIVCCQLMDGSNAFSLQAGAAGVVARVDSICVLANRAR